MTELERRQRLEFINSLQRYFQGILAKQALQSEPLISVLFEDRYDLENTTDIGVLLDRMDNKIDTELSPELYEYLTGGMETLTQMGVNHTVASSVKTVGDEILDLMNIYDRLALDYITRVGTDGKRLSDRIWSPDQKQIITDTIFEAIQNGWSKFELAEKLEEAIGESRYLLERIAETELTYAYSHSRVDTLLEEAELFPNAQAYVRISLSPAHPKPDICDAMEGIYKAEEAPLPPYHPHCICITESFIDTKGKETTSIPDQFEQYGDEDWWAIQYIETANGIVRTPNN